MRKEESSDKKVARFPRNQATLARRRAEWKLTAQLRRIAQKLYARSLQGDKSAKVEIKKRLAEGLPFRCVWSSLVAEHSRTGRAPRAEDFTSGAHKVQGGRVSPR
jgi:hypothetical protein